ncbi:MAG: fibronectin type III domain-containing protein, partial [Candidatus Thorarchaeota archaeon]
WSRQNATGFNHQGICVQATENTIFVGGQFNSSSSGFRLSFLSFNDSGAQNFIRIWGGAGPCQPTNLASASDSIYFSGTINNWLSSHDSGFLVKFGLDGESAPGPVAIHDVSLLSPYGSFVLEWTSALDPDGFIEDYELQMDTSPNFYRPDITWMVNTTYQFITNLPYGTYYFRVRACDNSNLYGPWSNIMVVIAALIPPTLFNPWLAPAILLLGTLVIVAIILFMVIRRRHFQ